MGNFVAWVKSHPMVMLLFVVVGIFGIVFLKKNQGASTATGSTAAGSTGAADLSGLATDANGNKIVYQHAADQFVNVNKTYTSSVTGSYNSAAPSTPIAPTPVASVPASGATPIEHPIEPSVLAPAKIGSLANTPLSSGTKNGVKDANSWIYTAPAGSTLESLNQFAKWGTDTSHIANYRNNKAVLTAAGVDVNNPYAHVPTGLKLSV